MNFARTTAPNPNACPLGCCASGVGSEAHCAVNAPVYSETLLRRDDDAQAPLALATSGVQRYVWESRFGEILIEVVGDSAFVNGQRVEPLDEPIQTDP
jgi:hypothetical protein